MATGTMSLHCRLKTLLHQVNDEEQDQGGIMYPHSPEPAAQIHPSASPRRLEHCQWKLSPGCKYPWPVFIKTSMRTRIKKIN